MVLPPAPFVSGGVVHCMVDGTKRHGELIAHFEPETSWLGVADVMSVARRSSANEARLLGDKAEMLLAAEPFRLADGKNALVDFLLGPDASPRHRMSTSVAGALDELDGAST